jgi:hypothetical protein
MAACAMLGLTFLPGCGGGSSVDEIIRASIEKTSVVRSFHFTLDVQNQPPSTSGLQLAAAEGNVSVPDRLRADVSGTFSGVALTSQLVVVGGTTVIKDPLTSAWRKVNVNTSPIPFFDPANGVLAVMRDARELEQAGSEEVGDVSTHRLRGSVTVAQITPLLGNPPSGETVDVTFWIGKDDAILRRVRVDGSINPGEPANVFRVLEISRFDEPVAIELPAGFE